MAAEVSALLGGHKPDVTIECSGVEASIRWVGSLASILVVRLCQVSSVYNSILCAYLITVQSLLQY